MINSIKNKFIILLVIQIKLSIKIYLKSYIYYEGWHLWEEKTGGFLSRSRLC